VDHFRVECRFMGEEDFPQPAGSEPVLIEGFGKRGFVLGEPFRQFSWLDVRLAIVVCGFHVLLPELVSAAFRGAAGKAEVRMALWFMGMGGASLGDAP
jgi:hypothetical protein